MGEAQTSQETLLDERISTLFRDILVRQCSEVLVDLQTKVHGLIIDCRNTLNQPSLPRDGVPRYIPVRTNNLPDLNRSDLQLTFTPNDIQSLVQNRGVSIIDDSMIKSSIPEPEIAGATERIILSSSIWKTTLYRGDLIRLESYCKHPGYYNHVLVVTNTQWMDASIALIRVAGYHVCGLPVDPSDDAFGTRILVVPSNFCDVIFPPALNGFALKVTETFPSELFYCIRTAAQTQT